MSGRILIGMPRAIPMLFMFLYPAFRMRLYLGVVRKSVSVAEIYAYDVPRIRRDFDENGRRLIGIEVTA